jgi:predicted nucleic acid-binding protein
MRVYLDTSVFGGCFDEEFQGASQKLFDAVLNGRVVALISDTLVGELVSAPKQVQNLLQRVIDSGCERITLSRETEQLQDAYLAAGVVTPQYADDALHVAHATLARADVIVSWNFKHLVNPSRVRAFNGVNIAQRYGQVIVMTPSDIVGVLEESDEEEKQGI